MLFLNLPTGQRLTVCGVDEVIARMAVCHEKPAVLSIQDPNAEQGHGKAPDLNGIADSQLVLQFIDTTQVLKGIAPTKKHVSDAMNFLRDTRVDDVIIHCKAGVARSAAMAAIFMDSVYGPGNEAKVIEDLLHIRPIAAPNPLILLLAGKRKLLRAALDNSTVFANMEYVHGLRDNWAKKNPSLTDRFLKGRELCPVHRILHDRLLRGK